MSDGRGQQIPAWLQFAGHQTGADGLADPKLQKAGEKKVNYTENAFRKVLILLQTFIIMYDQACK